MGYNRQKMLDIAKAELKYLEKASNAQLDDKSANAGNKNYTKYARDLDALGFFNGRKQGFAWCAVWVCWLFVQAFGVDAAKKLLCLPSKAASNCAAGCKYLRNYFKNKGQLFDTPEVGDVVFFYSSDREQIAHTGVVYKVDKTYVYTEEGNTSSSSGVVANGGGVFRKKYKLNYSRLAGFGRPLYNDGYGMAENSPSEPPAEKPEQIPAQPEKSQQAKETEGKLVQITLDTLKNGSKGEQVKTVQRLLNAMGYACGEVDGIFGHRTDGAVNVYQADKGLKADGIVGAKTWAALLK